MTMSEIQEAAAVITESVDPDAKIIFGAVRDDRLKKKEIKITVIATGFPGGPGESSSSGLFQFGNKDEDKDKSSFGSKEEKKETSKKDGDEDEDWAAVPAFLRRGKK